MPALLTEAVQNEPQMQQAVWSADLEGSQQRQLWLQGDPHSLHRFLEVVQRDVRLDGNGVPVQL